MLVDNVSDYKELKKIFRTKNNVMVLFTSNPKLAQNTIRSLDEAAQSVKGEATAIFIDCSLRLLSINLELSQQLNYFDYFVFINSADTKKLCKKMKVSPDPVVLKHFKEGEFHKDYDRKLTVSSLVNFLRDPTGDLPWEEGKSFYYSIVDIDFN